MEEARVKPKLNFPMIQSRSSALRNKQEFVPVIKSRRYNLLKIKQLYNHREKDKRLGRVQTQNQSLGNLLRAEAIQKERQVHYMVGRKQKYQKMKNHSYLSLMQKVRSDFRYCSLQR